MNDPLPPEPIDLPWLEVLSAAAFGVLAGGAAVFLLVRLFRSRLPAPPRPPRFAAELGLAALFLFVAVELVVPLLFAALSGDVEGEAAKMARAVFASVTANGLLVLLVILLARRRFGARPAELGLAVPRRPAAWVFAVLAFVLFLPIFQGAAVLNAKLVAELDLAPNQMLVRALLQEASLRSSVALVVCIAVLTPVVEEIVFRGVLQRALRAVSGPVPAVVGAALFFAAFHDPQSFLPIFVVGACLGLVCERTGSVWPAALLHAVFNGSQLVLIQSLSQS